MVNGLSDGHYIKICATNMFIHSNNPTSDTLHMWYRLIGLYYVQERGGQYEEVGVKCETCFFFFWGGGDNYF